MFLSSVTHMPYIHGGQNEVILMYIQQDATLHSVFISGNCSTRFRWFLHPSSGARTTVFTASGTCWNSLEFQLLHDGSRWQ